MSQDLAVDRGQEEQEHRHRRIEYNKLSPNSPLSLLGLFIVRPWAVHGSIGPNSEVQRTVRTQHCLLVWPGIIISRPSAKNTPLSQPNKQPTSTLVPRSEYATILRLGKPAQVVFGIRRDIWYPHRPSQSNAVLFNRFR